MKARLMAIGDYDDPSQTYTMSFIVEASEVDASSIKDGDEVEIISAAETCKCRIKWATKYCPHCGRRANG